MTPEILAPEVQEAMAKFRKERTADCVAELRKIADRMESGEIEWTQTTYCAPYSDSFHNRQRGLVVTIGYIEKGV